MKEITMRIPLKSEIMTTVRLTTGGVCSLAGLDIDRSEDCKVCVTESLLLLLHAGYREATIEFAAEDGLKISIAAAGERAEAELAPEDEISAALLGALAADVCTEKRGGTVCAVSFRFDS